MVEVVVVVVDVVLPDTMGRPRRSHFVEVIGAFHACCKAHKSHEKPPSAHASTAGTCGVIKKIEACAEYSGYTNKIIWNMKPETQQKPQYVLGEYEYACTRVYLYALVYAK